MARKRSKLEIYLDILRAIKRGVNKPTRIMYRTNLSWKPLQTILESMANQDLIRPIEVNKRRKYAITQKGENALGYFEEMMRLIRFEYETAESE